MDFFNNPEDSDAVLELRNGKRYFLHTIIIKSCLTQPDQLMNKAVDKKFCFPEYDDAIVLSVFRGFYYDEIEIHSYDVKVWCEQYRFAHSIGFTQFLKGMLHKIIPTFSIDALLDLYRACGDAGVIDYCITILSRSTAKVDNKTVIASLRAFSKLDLKFYNSARLSFIDRGRLDWVAQLDCMVLGKLPQKESEMVYAVWLGQIDWRFVDGDTIDRVAKLSCVQADPVVQHMFKCLADRKMRR
jgi:hypothetical protein